MAARIGRAASRRAAAALARRARRHTDAVRARRTRFRRHAAIRALRSARGAARRAGDSRSGSRKLVPLIAPAAQKWGVDLVAQGAPRPRADLQIPLLSLPLALGTTFETIPSRTPYLTAPSAYRASGAARSAVTRSARSGSRGQAASRSRKIARCRSLRSIRCLRSTASTGSCCSPISARRTARRSMPTSREVDPLLRCANRRLRRHGGGPSNGSTRSCRSTRRLLTSPARCANRCG